MPSITSSSSSILIPAEDQRELQQISGWKRHAGWIILGLAFLLGIGAGEPISVRSSTGHPISKSHISVPAIGRVESRPPLGSLALTDRDWTSGSAAGSNFEGGPPVP